MKYLEDTQQLTDTFFNSFLNVYSHLFFLLLKIMFIPVTLALIGYTYVMYYPLKLSLMVNLYLIQVIKNHCKVIYTFCEQHYKLVCALCETLHRSIFDVLEHLLYVLWYALYQTCITFTILTLSYFLILGIQEVSQSRIYF